MGQIPKISNIRILKPLLKPETNLEVRGKELFQNRLRVSISKINLNPIDVKQKWSKQKDTMKLIVSSVHTRFQLDEKVIFFECLGVIAALY